MENNRNWNKVNFAPICTAEGRQFYQFCWRLLYLAFFFLQPFSNWIIVYLCWCITINSLVTLHLKQQYSEMNHSMNILIYLLSLFLLLVVIVGFNGGDMMTSCRGNCRCYSHGAPMMDRMVNWKWGTWLHCPGWWWTSHVLLQLCSPIEENVIPSQW